MKRLRPKLNYANVVATLALVVAVGGTSAFAASQLGKNSVGPKQLKKNSVTTAKVKKEAITAAKVKKGSLTGAQINASTLGTVPTAGNANTAGTASIANSLAAPEAWHEVDQPGQPQFMNDWSNFGSDTATAAFYKDAQGVVHLKGTLTGSNDATAVFFLPTGFRPSQIWEYPSLGVSASASIGVFPNGEVRAVCNVSGCNPTINGITFRAES
jgi:hypothetical protein